MNIVVRNWDKFQPAIAKRGKEWRPPWIRVYTRLHDDPGYTRLTPRRRAILHSIWLLRAASGEDLPLDTAWLTYKFDAPSAKNPGQLDKVTSADLRALRTAGFIEFEGDGRNAAGERRRHHRKSVRFVCGSCAQTVRSPFCPQCGSPCAPTDKQPEQAPENADVPEPDANDHEKRRALEERRALQEPHNPSTTEALAEPVAPTITNRFAPDEIASWEEPDNVVELRPKPGLEVNGRPVSSRELLERFVENRPP